jgi:hypothetical protein
MEDTELVLKIVLRSCRFFFLVDRVFLREPIWEERRLESTSRSNIFLLIF